MLQLLQATEGLTLLESLTVYGPLGVWAGVATVGCYVLYKQNQKLHADAKDAMIKVTELVTKTLSAIQMSEKNTGKINELLFVLEDTKHHWKGVPDLKSKIEALITILEMKNNGMA
jgi:hypothetical protein